MRKFIFGIALFLTSALQVAAWQPDYQFDLSGGYRRDSIKWSMAGKNDVPNVLTDMQFKDLQMWQVGAEARFVACRTAYFRFNGTYGRVFHGHQHDQDYAGNDKTAEFLGTKAKVHNGEVYDVSGGIGYLFWFVGNKVTLAPIVGYSQSSQHLSMNNLVVTEGIFPVGPVPGLHSNYRARWMGPWAGIDMTYDTGCCDLRLLGTFEYHFSGRFNGSGHWNLREDFDHDFRQHAWAHGILGKLGIMYDFCCLSHELAIGFTGEYTRWKSNAGDQKIFVGDTKIERRLNHAVWKSWQFMGVLEYHY